MNLSAMAVFRRVKHRLKAGIGLVFVRQRLYARVSTVTGRFLLLRRCARRARWAGRGPQSHAPATTLEERYRRLLSDWASLNRFGSENTEVPPPAPGENRVVFIGDQFTELGQGAAKFFPGKPYFNRGISGQVTAQMLVRFRQDVIGLKPRVVVIHGGSTTSRARPGPGARA